MNNNENFDMKKMIFHRFIFILIFAICSVGITVFLVAKYSPIEAEENAEELSDSQKQTQVTEDEKTIDINGTYNENAIEAKKYSMDIQGYTIEYLQIDGLKDESIEIKINQEIKSTIQKEAQKLIEKEDVLDVYSYSEMSGNFANVLSIYSHVSVNFGNTEWEYANNYFNFDLTTGKKIELTDVFSSKISIKNVLIDNLYEAVISNQDTYYEDETGYLHLDRVNEDAEETVYAIVSDYLRGKDISFFITPQMIVIRNENLYAKILYADYLKYITIYDKFSQKTDIYDGKYTAQKDIPTLVDLNYFGESYLIEEQADNYYIRLGILNYSDIDKVEETVKNYVDELAEKYRKEAKESGIFKIYDGTFYIFENYDNFQFEDYIASANIYELDTTKSNFENVLKPKMIEHYRNDFSESPEILTREFVPYITNDYEIIEESMKLDNLGNILEENDNSNIIGIDD